ncbi:glycosyltransferase [Taibaiella koreensis]|uniref:glycosyltransferase n=1 Tax=Taibaiella koreensis TaxID=1268548 RepID=UPI0013C2EB38|nr:glycosyltransferase [Taibaiella koreensis]
MKILIAPLDWGLGHTTRCIPLIRYLLDRGHRVTVATEGPAATLLKDNFPGLPQLPLEGYRIKYSRSKTWFTFNILAQVPRILSAIRREHRWLAAVQQQQHFDLVLSDNRYGLYHAQLPCVILTHQLQIQSGQGAGADAWLRRLHYRMLERFDACWVVDAEADHGLSGKLAHPAVLPRQAVYIGSLSQFMDAGQQTITGNTILVLLSGPEPMRGQLERLVFQQAAALPQYSFMVVAGNPQGKCPRDLPAHIRYETHLAADALLPHIRAAALVICRSGYSTIMDLAVLNKKALLIPTPGQTEQEYLARYLQQKNYFTTVSQQALQLGQDIPKALAASVMPVRPLGTEQYFIGVLQPFLDLIAQQSPL